SVTPSEETKLGAREIPLAQEKISGSYNPLTKDQNHKSTGAVSSNLTYPVQPIISLPLHLPNPCWLIRIGRYLTAWVANPWGQGIVVDVQMPTPYLMPYDYGKTEV